MFFWRRYRAGSISLRPSGFPMSQDAPITELLQGLARGEHADGEQLAAAVLDRLRAIAYKEMAARHRGPLDAMTIEPGVLANDAFMKVLGKKPQFENRRHFFAYATQVMVRALIDYQREKRAQKRGGDLVRVTLSKLDYGEEAAVDVEALPPILEDLSQLDERKAEIVQLRVFWGMTVQEIASLLEVSESTVDRDWKFARRWMSAQLRRAQAEPSTAQSDPAAGARGEG